MTSFQSRVLEFVRNCEYGYCSTWEIAQGCFPEKWRRVSSRGALIQHIDRAGITLGLTRLPPHDQYGEAVFSLPTYMRAENQ